MAIVEYCTAYSKDENPDSVKASNRYKLDKNHNYDATDDDIDFELCIEECADDYFDNHDGWESKWPCLFMLWIDNQYLGMFEVELEHQPTFSANKVE